MTELMKTLLLLSASGSGLGLLLILARRLSGKRLPSTLWYYAWLPVLVRFVLPLPGLIPEAQTSAQTKSAPVLVQMESAEKRSYRYDGYEAYDAPSEDGEEADMPTAEAVVHTETVSETAPAEPAQPRIQPGKILKTPGFWLAVWLIGAVLCLTRYTAGYVRFRRVLMRTLETTDGQTARAYRELNGLSRPKLFASAYVKTPMLLGLRRPLIVLPQGEYSAQSARNILRHELTHYRRGDLYIKWFFVLVASLHWFNPLMPLFRRELDRVCELSCDENVLARMQPSERRSYGETLLDLAANRTLPAGVVATTFATEKRALKERLEHIMKFKYKPRAILALTAAAILLMGVTALAAAPARASAASEDSPEPTPMPKVSASASAEGANVPASASAEAKSVTSAGVDEFLSAIAPNTTITLKPGTYNLSMASNYGKNSGSDYYHWERVSDGFELVIENVENLSIVASPGDVTETVISAVPRYADVLAFLDCDNITLAGFTAGHTVEPGVCMGGVVHLMGTANVSIESCALYGCGVLGVDAENCQNIFVSRSDIYECSSGAVELTSCRNVQFEGCVFRDCYARYDGSTGPAYKIFSITSCYGVAVTNSRVYGNYAREMVHVKYSQEVYLLGTLFEENEIESDALLPYSSSVLSVAGEPITVAGCEFRDDFAILDGGESPAAVGMDGSALSSDDLASMKQEPIDFPGFAGMEVPALERRLDENGMYAVDVSTVDELLAAIAPNTTIYLAEGLYDLSEAANYGAYGSSYYHWLSVPDGVVVVISGVENLSIVGAGKGATRIEALPRYADVLRFDDCQNVSVSGVTAGHTLGAGTCSGAVLTFRDCEGAEVRDCGLFGCGTYGVEATNCTGITAEGNEIYECSYGAVQLRECKDAVFAQNDIHDCAYPTYSIYGCVDIVIDGETVKGQLSTFDVPGAGPYKSAAAQG